MKKSHIFIAVYILIMLALGVPALSQMKLSKTYEMQTSPTLEIMLLIACCMAVFLLLVLVIWRIAKFVLVKLGKRPDDYFVLRFSAPKTIDHIIWTRSGRYKKEEDPSEKEFGNKRNTDNTEIEW